MADERSWRDRVLDRDVLAGVGLCVFLTAHVAYYFPRVVDDLFISLRYAENLAAGRGAVYNVGERVEGYSSPAWMFVQTIGFVLQLEPVTFTKTIAIVCLIATAFGAREVVKQLYGVTGWPSWIPAYACATCSYLVDWTVLGLETPFHVAALVLCPLAVARAVDAPSGKERRRFGLAILALVALGTSRPESAVYVMINVLAPLARADDRASLVRLVRRVLPVALGAGLVLGGLLALRFAYYGELVPNTYFVKGAHASFSLAKLLPLMREGCSPAEAVFYVSGLITLGVYSVQRRAVAPALSALFCLYFTAKVAIDWMPSLRHLLPALVFASFGWACFVAKLREANARVPLIAAQAILLTSAAAVLSVDVRLSVIEHRAVWVVRKSRAKWSDTVLAYRRVEPPHVAQMDGYAMGQISQAWAVLETSTEPIERSWYAGRDIGAVGFYTGVRVFDTAGLVTTEVSRSDAWAARGEVPDALVQKMMATHPIAADIFDGWDDALGRNQALLASYNVVSGSPESPSRIVATNRTAPSKAERVRRYQVFVRRFPRLFHLHTLYGESMGAAVERRLRIVESVAHGETP